MANMILEVLDGPGAGGQLWLKDGQRAEIGRAEWVDLSVPEDDRLADVQFAIEFRRGRAWLRKPEPGTWINGAEQDQDVGLRSGDQIAAGRTLFSITIHGVPTGDGAPPAVDEPPPPPKPAVEFDPHLLMAEKSFRLGLDQIESVGPVHKQAPATQHTYVIYLQELANILNMQGRKQEADETLRVADYYLKMPELKKYLSGQ
jgi:hypothetical protein